MQMKRFKNCGIGGGGGGESKSKIPFNDAIGV